jgi:hypothetical protein
VPLHIKNQRLGKESPSKQEVDHYFPIADKIGIGAAVTRRPLPHPRKKQGYKLAP